MPVGNRNDTFGETKNEDGRSEVEMRPITKGVLTRCGGAEVIIIDGSAGCFDEVGVAGDVAVVHAFGDVTGQDMILLHGNSRIGRSGRERGPSTRTRPREWMGIEPTSPDVNRDSTALKAAGPTRRPDTPRCKAYLNQRGAGVPRERSQVGNLCHTC